MKSHDDESRGTADPVGARSPVTGRLWATGSRRRRLVGPMCGTPILGVLLCAILLISGCADVPYRAYAEEPCQLEPRVEEREGLTTRVWEWGPSRYEKWGAAPCPWATHVAYRGVGADKGGGEGAADGAAEGRHQGAHQGSHSVNYVEVDEQGILADRRAAEQALRVAAALPAPGRRASYVVVFIHGWHHDAHPDDSNVQGFHDALASLADWHPSVDVRGIYIGWKGESIPVFPLNYLLTFWSRKGTSEEVGRGMLTEFLLRLEQGVKRGRSDNRLVLIGHSFGASVSFNALASVYLTRFMEGLQAADGTAGMGMRAGPPGHDRGPGRSRFIGYGDMVVLINPAIEAMRFMPLQSAIHYYKQANPSGLRADFSHETQPRLLVLSSQGDWATRVFFKGARVFTTLREAHNVLPEGRGGVAGAVGGEARDPGDSEWVMDLKTVGNYARFHTHEPLGIRAAAARGGDLSLKGEPAPSAALADCPMVGPTQVRRTLFETPGVPIIFKGSQVSMTRKAGHPDGSPYLLLDVGTELIADHTAIGNPNFICWVNQMVDASD